MQKQLKTVFLLIFIIGLIGCSKEAVKEIPLTNLDNFTNDSKEIVTLFENKLSLESLELLSENESTAIKNYLGKYDNNPRLSKDQAFTVSNIKTLNVAYSAYFKDKIKSIETANGDIQVCFTMLKLLKN